MKRVNQHLTGAIGAVIPIANQTDLVLRVASIAGRKPRSIMVVDDVEMNRDLISTILERNGHNVLRLPDGESAIFAAERTIFDLVLMDIRMPNMDGLETTRRIRGLNNQNRTIPILGLTANVTLDRVNECMAAGMDDQVSKSISVSDLLDKVTEWSDRADRCPSSRFLEQRVR